MKKWEQPLVTVTYRPRFPELLARVSLCIGVRWNLSTEKRYPVRVYSRDETPLADAILQAYAWFRGA